MVEKYMKKISIEREDRTGIEFSEVIVILNSLSRLEVIDRL